MVLFILFEAQRVKMIQRLTKKIPKHEYKHVQRRLFFFLFHSIHPLTAPQIYLVTFGGARPLLGTTGLN